ncbi:MAG: hypothetical protein BGO03_03290 [Mesorhizobium sp. 61-13]|nr:MAG: hypothetical protein BGO03_03290 [Mesorhizobium sp. 61-13]
MRSKKIEPILVDPAQVSTAEGHAVPIKKFKNLDRYLAAVVEPVAHRRHGELSVAGSFAHLERYADDFSDRVAQQEVVTIDFNHTSHPAETFEQVSNLGFTNALALDYVTDSRRSKARRTAEHRPDYSPEYRILRRQLNDMVRRLHPGAVHGNMTGISQLSQRGNECRCR